MVETGDSPAGEGAALGIVLAHNSGSSPFSQVWWDHVRLDRVPASVPEPALASLLALAAVGLLRRRR